jgi:hypothetical protein
MTQDDLFLVLATVSVVVALGILAAFVLWSRATQRRSARQAGTDGSVLNNWTGATRNQHKVLWYSVATMSIIMVCVGSIPTYLLYNAFLRGNVSGWWKWPREKRG